MKLKLKRNLTNTQRITQYMNEHPLNQAFVMEAMGRYAKAVVADKVRLVESMQNSPVSGEAWVASAEAWVADVKGTTDTQRITQYMNEHPLNQAVVMEAMGRYVKTKYKYERPY